MSILAIDAGTTGVTCLLVDERGKIVAKGYQEFEQYFPNPGWVEHEPEQIWQAVLTSAKKAIDASPTVVIRAIGITNQRETVALWNRETLESPRRAIAPRRSGNSGASAPSCSCARSTGHRPTVPRVLNRIGG